MYKIKESGRQIQAKLCEEKNVVHLTFPILEQAGLRHGFSTRLGGVSEGIFSSMNLSFTRGDKEEHVRENYRRMGEALGFDPNRLVFSDQVHETRIYDVREEDAGRGIIKERVIGIDGLATDIAGIPMVTFYADCVPLIFYDPVRKAVAMAHSGWRGTVARIGQKMAEHLKEHYHCCIEDILVVVGPSICQDCYEISEDVASEFETEFGKKAELFLVNNQNGKYHLDLWKANEVVLLEAGIQKDNLSISGICTCCNKELLFSHRASQGKRGNLGAFVMLDE